MLRISSSDAIELTDGITHAIGELKGSGVLGDAVKVMLAIGYRYAVKATHVDTGSWRSAHRTKMRPSGLRGEIYIDPSVTNSCSTTRVIDYATKWEKTGGEMAVYSQTVRGIGVTAEKKGVRMVTRGVFIKISSGHDNAFRSITGL